MRRDYHVLISRNCIASELQLQCLPLGNEGGWRMLRLSIFTAVALATALLAGPVPAWSDDETYTLTIKDRQFAPIEIQIPVGKKITLTVKNLDAAPSEFESTDLNREKVVGAGGTVTVFIGPLRAGSYEFFDDFNPETVHGRIVAK